MRGYSHCGNKLVRMHCSPQLGTQLMRSCLCIRVKVEVAVLPAGAADVGLGAGQRGEAHHYPISDQLGVHQL